MTNGDYSSFCGQLDSALHGNVHVYTGDASNMGNVPTAAGDPIFWLHHCNIDRIWMAWNALGHKNPGKTSGRNWSATKFVFVSDAGKRVELSIDRVSDPVKLPYRYDTLPTPTLVAENSRVQDRLILRSVRPGGASGGRAGAVAGPVALGQSAQTVKLEPAEPQNRLLNIAPRLAAEGGRRLVLVLNNVQASADPRTTYEVYFDLPAGTSPAAADDHYVGLVNFFGASNDQGHSMRGGKTVEFDVSALIRKLGGRLQEETSVTLVPVGAPAAGATPTIGGGIELRAR
jgi:tyrosinase